MKTLFLLQLIPWALLLGVWVLFAAAMSVVTLLLSLAASLLKGLALGLHFGTWALLGLLFKIRPALPPDPPSPPTATAPVTPALSGGLA